MKVFMISKREGIIGLLSLGAFLKAAPDIFWGKLFFQVAPPSPVLQAQVEWHFKGENSALLVWDLGAGLSIQALEASHPLDTFWHDTLNRKVYVYFSSTLQGMAGWIRVKYQGVPRSSGFGSYELKAHATGWCLWTLSQPYGAPDWLFCRDGLSDKVDSLDITLRTPDTLIGVANGRLLADSVDTEGWRWRHFQHRYPIAVYLIAFAVSNYVVQEIPVQTPASSFVLRNYVFPQDTGIARQLSLQFLPYFTWIENKVGPYPFASEDYQQVQIGWRGGMEHQTITFFGSYSLELWAHELAHQWFGDWVTCGSWHDIWLNESFATYLGGCVFEALGSSWWNVWLRGAILRAWTDTIYTVWVEDTTDIFRIFRYTTTYLKGALALHTLRDYLGEEAFWTALRHYLTAQGGGFALTADFAEKVKPYWGATITAAFLDSWIYSPGYPRASFIWENVRSGQYIPLQPYPIRVEGRAILASQDTQGIELDLMVPSVQYAFSEPVLRLEVDPDTLTPYWGFRYAAPSASYLFVGPNPFSEYLFLAPSHKVKQAILYDGLGREIERYVPTSKEMTLLWQLSPLPPGVYILSLIVDEGVVNIPLLRSDR
ncbi:MAG: M1 family aminopeptidase [Bacteroidia bacterium]|nr:M1 family aminopeptidase [Bacteroidia bacterium]MDW8134447.1 M1 family aminopeptidase [Bacteroidia bacterium]